MSARKLHTVGFEYPTLATNSLFIYSRKLLVRLSLLIVLEGLQQDDQQIQPHEQLPGEFFMLWSGMTQKLLNSLNTLILLEM